MTRTYKLSLFFVAAAFLALSTFTTAAPVPPQGSQLVIAREEVVDGFSYLEKEEPNHECGHDESDYEDGDEDYENDDEDNSDYDDAEEEEDEQEESTEEDLQAAGESEDDYYVGQTYTGLIFDTDTGKGVALTTADVDQDLLELSLFLRRKKVTSFEEIWNDVEDMENSEEDGVEYEEDEDVSLAEDDIDIQRTDDLEEEEEEEEEEEDTFESET